MNIMLTPKQVKALFTLGITTYQYNGNALDYETDDLCGVFGKHVSREQIGTAATFMMSHRTQMEKAASDNTLREKYYNDLFVSHYR